MLEVGLLAVCRDCGETFTSGFAIGLDPNEPVFQHGMTWTNNEAGPCPKCNGMGFVPSGIYRTVGSAVHLIAAPDMPQDELRLLEEVLRRASKGEISPTALREELAASSDERIRKLADILPTKRDELYNFVLCVLTLIGIALAAIAMHGNDQDSSAPISDDQIAHIISETVRQVTAQQPPPQQSLSP